jgi:SagB-type dehydrogenase family enzyme
VATLLVRAGRLRDWMTSDDGYLATHRPAPSAGARHPFELLLLAGKGLDGLESGAYRFDPIKCALAPVPTDEVSSEEFLLSVGNRLGQSGMPPAAICLVAHLDRTLGRYPSGMSLVWRDAGAILQTLHLCATDLGLRSCVVGSCGLLYDEQRVPIVDAGCLAVGGDPN